MTRIVLLRSLRLPGCLFAVGLVLAACSPTYNWRELTVEGSLGAWIPCKPLQVTRQAALSGQTLPMTVYACEAGGQNWAVSTVGVADPTRLAGVQQALDAALAVNLSTRLPTSQVPTAPGLAEARGLRRYQMHGRRPDGVGVTVDWWSFVRGGQVYQASVIRAESVRDEPDLLDARNTFFGALKFGH